MRVDIVQILTTAKVGYIRFKEQYKHLSYGVVSSILDTCNLNFPFKLEMYHIPVIINKLYDELGIKDEGLEPIYDSFIENNNIIKRLEIFDNLINYYKENEHELFISNNRVVGYVNEYVIYCNIINKNINN